MSNETKAPVFNTMYSTLPTSGGSILVGSIKPTNSELLASRAEMIDDGYKFIGRLAAAEKLPALTEK